MNVAYKLTCKALISTVRPRLKSNALTKTFALNADAALGLATHTDLLASCSAGASTEDACSCWSRGETHHALPGARAPHADTGRGFGCAHDADGYDAVVADGCAFARYANTLGVKVAPNWGVRPCGGETGLGEGGGMGGALDVSFPYICKCGWPAYF